MKKIIGIIAVMILAAAAWAGATYYIGGEIEKNYCAFLDQYSQQQPYIVLEKKSYRKGFLKSTAETVVTIPLLSKLGEENGEERPSFSFVMEHTLRHGPLPFGKNADGGMLLKPCLAYVETRFPKDSEKWGILEKLLKNVPEMANSYSYGIVDFAGTSTNRTVIPAAEVDIPEENIKITWQGLDSQGQYSRDFTMIGGRMTVPGFEMQFKDGLMRMTGISCDFDLKKAFDYIYVGDFGMVMDSLEMQFPSSDGDWEQVVLRKLAVDSTSNCKGEMVNYQQTMSLESLNAAEETYGPAVLDMELLNLNGPTLSKFQEEMQGMQAGFLGMNKEEMEAASLRIMQLYTTLLFKGSPEYNIRELKLSTPKGDISCNMRLRLENADGSAMQNPAMLVNHLEAEAGMVAGEQLIQAFANFSLKEAVKKQLSSDPNAPALTEEQIDDMVGQQVEAQLQNLTAQQFLVRENNSYKAQAAFKQGVLTINGREIPLPGQHSNNEPVMH